MANILDSLDPNNEAISSGTDNQSNSSLSALPPLPPGGEGDGIKMVDPSSRGASAVVNQTQSVQKVIDAQRSQLAFLQNISQYVSTTRTLGGGGGAAVSGGGGGGGGNNDNNSTTGGVLGYQVGSGVTHPGPASFKRGGTPPVFASGRGLASSVPGMGMVSPPMPPVSTHSHMGASHATFPGRGDVPSRLADHRQTFDYGNHSNVALEMEAAQQLQRTYHSTKDKLNQKGWWP